MSQIYLFNVVWRKWKNAWIWFKKFIFLGLKIGLKAGHTVEAE